jgi:hypothetical protein
LLRRNLLALAVAHRWKGFGPPVRRPFDDRRRHRRTRRDRHNPHPARRVRPSTRAAIRLTANGLIPSHSPTPRRIRAGRVAFRYVSPLSPPNRTCTFQHIRLSRDWLPLPRLPLASSSRSRSQPAPFGSSQTFMGLLLLVGIWERQSPAALRPVAGFPNLRLL